MLINLFILSACSKTDDFCVLKSIKSNRQSDFTNLYKDCKEKDNFIDALDFEKFINTTSNDRVNFTLFGFYRKFPLVINLSKTRIKFFDIRGGEKNQFVYFNGIKKGITIQASRINILFDETKISLKTAILSKSIIYSPNGEINLFVDSLTTDGFSLKSHFFSNITCYQYKLTSRVKPTAKIYILHDNDDFYSEVTYENLIVDNNNSTRHQIFKSDSKNQTEYRSNFSRYNNYYHKIINFSNSKSQNIKQYYENEESFQHHSPFNNDFIEYPQYVNDHLSYIKSDQFLTTELNDTDEILSSSDVKYCLCMKSRLNRCKESMECDSYFIPIENYVTGKEAWFKYDISHSVNRTIRLYVAGTEGMTMNIGFEDFYGKNNTVYINLANLNSPAYVSIGGKYMSSSTSQLGVFSVIFTNINQVSLSSDIIQKLNDVTLRQSPLFIRPSHHLTIHKLITDTRSISSFEGTLYISEFLVLNNSEPLLIEGTLYLEEGCMIYVPQVSLFPNVFVNDEYILFSDGDQDNDLVLYFSEITNKTKKWTFYMSNEILIEDGKTYPSVNFYLKTNSESIIPLLFIFDIQYQGISLVYDDISKLPETIEMEVVTSKEDKSKLHYLELQVDYTDEPKSNLFNQISGNIDLVLLTSKTIQYFLGNENPPSCFNQTNPSGNCSGINLFGLNSLTFYVYYSMTKILFDDDSITIYFGDENISFSSSLTNSIQVIADLQSELQMSISPTATSLFPLSLVLINNNSVINFDESFSYLDQTEQIELASNIYIYHENLSIDLVSSILPHIPVVVLDHPVLGVLFNTYTDIKYDIYKSTNFSQNSYRSGPKITVNIVDNDVVVPQPYFLAYEVTFCGKPFTFSIGQKSRCTYIFDNEVDVFIKDDVSDNFSEFGNTSNPFELNDGQLKTELLNENDALIFNYSKAILLDESVDDSNVVKVSGLVFTKSGKFSQKSKIKLFADKIESQTVSAIDESNFIGPISLYSNFQLNDSTISVIELTIDSVRMRDEGGNSVFLLQARKDATFDVIYELTGNESTYNNNNIKNKIQHQNQHQKIFSENGKFFFDNKNDIFNRNIRTKSDTVNNKVITIKVLDKDTEILKNFKLTIRSPVSIYFDKSWYNVTNPEDLTIVADKDIKMQTELLKMPNFTLKLYENAAETVVVKKPKHTAPIAFYTFLALAIAVFIVCITFCVIDFCCILKPKSVEIDLGSSSSDRSLDDLPFTYSSSYEYYSINVEEEEDNNDEYNKEKKERDVVADPPDVNDDNNNNNNLNLNSARPDYRSSIQVTSYGNTTAEWRAEHMRKRRKRPKLDDTDDEDLSPRKRKNKRKKKDKKDRKSKKLKPNEKEFDEGGSETNEIEENYYDENT